MTAHAQIRMALRRLDVRLAYAVMRLRARYQLSLDEFRGLYVSDAQVDALLQQSHPDVAMRAPLPRLRLGPILAGVVQRFALSPLATEMLLLALAAECDPRYATLIAYLNDDVQRRLPTFDLAWRLFGTASLPLAVDGPLFGPGLLVRPTTTERRPHALQDFAAHPLLIAHALGETPPGLAVLPPIGDTPAGALADIAPLLNAAPPPVILLSGRPRSGRSHALRCLAGQSERVVLRLDLVGEPAPQLRDAALAARLADAILLIDPGQAGLAPLMALLRQPATPVFVLVGEDGSWRQALAGCATLEVRFGLPNVAARQALWAASLAQAGLHAEAGDVQTVAARFRLTRSQITAAGTALRLERRLGPGGSAVVDGMALTRMARAQSSAGLAGLATRVTPRHDWGDLVLPAATLRQLRHFGGAIRHRSRVFGDWGFARGTETGLIALFSGGSGTGKSMSAGVLAQEAGLEIWRIDLSAVVSKYIGETEKQLERIFTLARDGNAILFFDEADALFGKRSEVKDAHDRYANIEVAYLLQRLEAYDGVAILATNLARNVDRAFSRRMHVVIEFPQPDAELREQLWRRALPDAAPVAAEIDFAFLGRQFAFAGGDIRVAALDAAFAAAVDGVAIDMARLLQAVARQLLKQGKVPAASDFRQYHALLAETGELTRSMAAE